jgi:hypothetical protein
MDVYLQQRILGEVGDERERQFNKWGDQIHTVTHWMAILVEEVGEADKEAVEYEVDLHPLYIDRMRKELIEAAAVAVAMVEWIDEGATYPPWYEKLTPEFIRQFVDWYQKHAFPDRAFTHEKIAEFKPDENV